MKLHRSRMITILMVVRAICSAILLSGCVSTGDGKDTGPEMESPGTVDKRSTALKETSGSSPEIRKEPVASMGGSGQKPHGQEASLKANEDRSKHFATDLEQGPHRTLSKTLPDKEWNGEVIAVGGILAMSLIYGLAFRLARPPRRRRGGSRRPVGSQIGAHAIGSVP